MQTAALQGVLAKFGIREIARTGKIALKRGEHLLEMGGWGDGVARHAKERQNVNVGEDGAQVSTAGEPASSSAQAQERSWKSLLISILAAQHAFSLQHALSWIMSLILQKLTCVLVMQQWDTRESRRLREQMYIPSTTMEAQVQQRNCVLPGCSVIASLRIFAWSFTWQQ